MKIPVFSRLYVRLWLAVVLAVCVLALFVNWLLSVQAERLRADIPMRQVVVRDATGQVLGQVVVQPVRVPGRGLEIKMDLPPAVRGGEQISIGLMGPRPPAAGKEDRLWLPRWLNPANPAGAQRVFVFLLIMFAIAVALGSYPVVRRLTQRLERLQRGVESLGAGDLRARVPEEGRDEVAYLARRFNHAADRIEALVQSHKSLLANASHELRSPLARIRMGLELVDSSASPKLRDELARNINELDALIDEILLASRLDAAQHGTEGASAAFGVREAVDMIALAAEEGARVGVELSVSPGLKPEQAVVQGQAKLLRRLLRNLLENAQRYAGQGAIELALGLTQTPGMLRVQVSDHGPGVPAAERERIFEPFYRSSHASESAGGVGLGLALVKSIAQQHGGSVLCMPREGAGTTGARFVVDLPQLVVSMQR
jgi:two-component system, OmpR family, sensor kinase